MKGCRLCATNRPGACVFLPVLRLQHATPRHSFAPPPSTPHPTPPRAYSPHGALPPTPRPPYGPALPRTCSFIVVLLATSYTTRLVLNTCSWTYSSTCVQARRGFGFRMRGPTDERDMVGRGRDGTPAPGRIAAPAGGAGQRRCQPAVAALRAEAHDGQGCLQCMRCGCCCSWTYSNNTCMSIGRGRVGMGARGKEVSASARPFCRLDACWRAGACAVLPLGTQHVPVPVPSRACTCCEWSPFAPPIA